MADVFKATKTPIFGPYAPWSAGGDDLSSTGFRQPEQIKINFNLDKKDGKKKTMSLSAYVTPDQGKCAEFFLFFVYPQFLSNVMGTLPEDFKDDAPLRFMLFEKTLQGSAKTIWQLVYTARITDNSELTLANFKSCVQDYLEKVASAKNLGNQVVRWLRTAKKPLGMPVDAWATRRRELEGYLREDGLLRTTISMPNGDEKKETNFFLCMPKAYQEKYAENKASVEEIEDQTAVFQQYFDTDKSNGTLKALE